MNLRFLGERRLAAPVVGAGIAVLCGLALWMAPWTESWRTASYDDVFRFRAKPVTNRLALILLDNDAYQEFHQVRPRWSRGLHTRLLNKLADDGCPLVVFDVFFGARGDDAEDEALAKAMQRQPRIVLGAKLLEETEDDIYQLVQTNLPAEPFLTASRTNWGIAKAETNLVDGVVRRHWPPRRLGSDEMPPSLPWTAARLAGVAARRQTTDRWLRYHGYGKAAAWTYLSFGDALSQSNDFFRDRIVFIGGYPTNALPNGEPDEFRTPYTGWTQRSSAGVEVLATQFLNLANGDWLERPAAWVEVLVLLGSGILLGGGFCRMRLWVVGVAGTGVLLALPLGAWLLSYCTNLWFPWRLIAGGPLPAAVACAAATTLFRALRRASTRTVIVRDPEAPDYERFGPPFGEGGFGKVWIVRNAIGQWQALKEVYKDNFGAEGGKFEMEFHGIQKYKPISHEHPGLLRIEFVSRPKRAGHFYYVMELGDPLDPDNGWEQNPSLYRPRDLRNACLRSERSRLPVRECIDIGIALADALEFLHSRNLTHRDIKPGNVIFVKGRPKLADAGTVTVLRAPEEIATRVVTLGYTPPDEMPGTRQADIYSLGKLLYVISTGRSPGDDFPSLSTTLIEQSVGTEFMKLNDVILKACQPNPRMRYDSAEKLRLDLQALLHAQT